MKRYTVLIILLGLTATFADAQFPIRVPKVRIQKVETPKSENTWQPNPVRQPAVSESNARVSTQINASTTVQIIDSMTFFALEEVRVSHKSVGWYLKPKLTFKGSIPKRSAVRIVVKKNGKELSNLRCEIEEGRVFRCDDKKQDVREMGLLDVEVSFIDGDTDEQKALRTYKIDVHRTERFNDYADYFAQRHADVAVAYLSLEGQNPWEYPKRNDSLFKGDTDLFLNTVVSRDHEEKYSGAPFLRCAVNGQPFKLAKTNVKFNQVEGSVFARFESRKGSVYKAYLKFAKVRMKLPLSLGKAKNTNFSTDISKTPGDWSCTITGSADRELYRTFRFTIDGNGRIVPHPEQVNGTAVFADWEFMIDMEIPAGGSPIDQRLMRSPKAGFFYGIPWSTPEGKAIAERLPTKGNPYPKPKK